MTDKISTSMEQPALPDHLTVDALGQRAPSELKGTVIDAPVPVVELIEEPIPEEGSHA